MSKCKITGKVLAIQLGRDETKIALMSSASEIISSKSIPTPPGAVEDGMIRNQEAVHKMLKAALSTPEFKGNRRVVFSLCTSQVISDTVATPQVSEQKLEKLIQSNADMYFPVDMKEYKLVWQVIGPRVKENGLKELAVQLWAVPTAMVSRYYAVANACGLSVEAIDYCGNSVASAVGATFSIPVKKAAKAKKKLSLNTEISFGKKKEAVEPEAPVAVEDREIPATQAYISLDSDLLGMTFVQEGRVVLQRFIQCGSDASYQLSELAMLLDYYSALEVGRGSPVTAHVFGSLAGDKALVADLADMLGTELQVMEPVSSAKYLLCTGAAQTCMDFGVPSLNRARAASKQVGSQLWQYVLVLAGGAVLAVAIMLLLSSRLIWSSEINGLKASQQALAIQAQKYNGFKDNYDQYSSLYDSYSGDWDTVFANLRTNNDKLVMVLEELESMLPETTSVTNLIISPDGLSVSFACADKEEAAYLIMALRKLKYSELTSISNLMGGGKGPATSYGPNREPEKAPSKGGYVLTYTAKPSIGNLIADEVSKEELMQLAVTLTPEQYDLLEQAYGVQPEAKYESIEALKKDETVSVSFQQRCDAFEEMLTTNPFAANGFLDLMNEDMMRDYPILYLNVLREMIVLEEEGKLPSGDDLQGYVEMMVYIVTKNEENMSAAEELLATSEKMEKTYLHYLEVEASIRTAESFPFLNMQALMEDLMAGSFDTTDPELDRKLNGLLSQEAWDMLGELSSEENIAQLLDKYLKDGTTGNEALDALINEYLTTGTTGSDKLDEIIKGYLGSGYLDSELEKMVQKYLTTGTSGDATVDAMIAAYLTTGTTGNEQMDKVIKKYIEAGNMNDEIAALVEKYLTTGTTGNTVIDSLLAKYLTDGSTGNTQLDAMIAGYLSGDTVGALLGSLLDKYLADNTTGNKTLDELLQKYFNTGSTGNVTLDNLILAYLKTGAVDKVLGELLQKYLKDGSTGNTALDAIIEKFLNTGSTGNKAIDDIITAYINAGNLDTLVTDLMEKYLADGTTGSAALDNLIKKFLTDGTTGNKLLDEIIKNYINGGYLDAELEALMKKFLKDGTTGNTVLDDLIKKFLTTGTTGNLLLDKLIKKFLGGGGSGGGLGDLLGGLLGGLGNQGGGMIGDTRIMFNVILVYKDELIQAEMDRKDLDPTAKVDKLEVAE